MSGPLSRPSGDRWRVHLGGMVTYTAVGESSRRRRAGCAPAHHVRSRAQLVGDARPMRATPLTSASFRRRRLTHARPLPPCTSAGTHRASWIVAEGAAQRARDGFEFCFSTRASSCRVYASIRRRPQGLSTGTTHRPLVGEALLHCRRPRTPPPARDLGEPTILPSGRLATCAPKERQHVMLAHRVISMSRNADHVSCFSGNRVADDVLDAHAVARVSHLTSFDREGVFWSPRASDLPRAARASRARAFRRNPHDGRSVASREAVKLADLILSRPMVTSGVVT